MQFRIILANIRLWADIWSGAWRVHKIIILSYEDAELIKEATDLLGELRLATAYAKKNLGELINSGENDPKYENALKEYITFSEQYENTMLELLNISKGVCMPPGKLQKSLSLSEIKKMRDKLFGKDEEIDAL